MAAPIRTDVAIRPYADGDHPLLVRLLGDPAMTVHLGGPESPDALRSRHERYLASEPSSGGIFTVLAEPEREPVGWIGYWRSSWDGEDVWECGWHVLAHVQGTGIATAATTLVLDRVVERGEYRYLHAFPSVDNAASNALCRRLGFECLGETEVEYPKGRMMRANNWRYALEGVAEPSRLR